MESEYKEEGLTTLRCSNCDKAILSLWENNPEEDVTFNVVARCCFCGDRSFPKTVKGRFGIGGYSVPNPKNPEHPIAITQPGPWEYEGDLVIINTRSQDCHAHT